MAVRHLVSQTITSVTYPFTSYLVIAQEEDELDLEDEDPQSEDVNDEEDEEEEISKSNAPLTARQAALAGAKEDATPQLSLGKSQKLLLQLTILAEDVCPTHSTDALLTNNRRRGPQKTEQEILAKKHEAAKRRKLAMQQKTADDKVRLIVSHFHSRF